MESEFTLRATDKEANALFLSTAATVKLMEFKGDKEKYPKMDYNSSVIHKWRVILRHNEAIGEIKGTRTYTSVMRLLTH